MRLSLFVELGLLAHIRFHEVPRRSVLLQVDVLLVLFDVLHVVRLHLLVLTDDLVDQAAEYGKFVVKVGILHGNPVERVTEVFDRFVKDSLDFVELVSVALKALILTEWVARWSSVRVGFVPYCRAVLYSSFYRTDNGRRIQWRSLVGCPRWHVFFAHISGESQLSGENATGALESARNNRASVISPCLANRAIVPLKGQMPVSSRQDAPYHAVLRTVPCCGVEIRQQHTVEQYGTEYREIVVGKGKCLQYVCASGRQRTHYKEAII